MHSYAARTSIRPVASAAIRSSASRLVSAGPVLRLGHLAVPSSAGTMKPMERTFFTSYFSTTSKSAAEKDEKTVEEKKEDEVKATAETMGAKQNASEGKEEDPALTELKNAIKEKDDRIKDLTDRMLYQKAELQNVQRRATEEKQQASVYGITKLARDLTSSLDVLALALRSVPEPLRKAPEDASSAAEDPRKAVAELYSGVELTSKSILDMLKMHGITAFDPTGEKFDPQQHEAIFQAPVPGKEPGTVLECSKIGYRINDRILRAAQVGVVQSAPQQSK